VCLGLCRCALQIDNLLITHLLTYLLTRKTTFRNTLCMQKSFSLSMNNRREFNTVMLSSVFQCHTSCRCNTSRIARLKVHYEPTRLNLVRITQHRRCKQILLAGRTLTPVSKCNAVHKRRTGLTGAKTRRHGGLQGLWTGVLSSVGLLFHTG